MTPAKHTLLATSIRLLALAALTLAVCVACAPNDYLLNRGRDAADIVTFTIGNGGGCTARMGPIHAGLYFGEDRGGLKGGELGWSRQYSVSNFTLDPLLVFPNPGGPPLRFWQEGWDGGWSRLYWSEDRRSMMHLSSIRHKDYVVDGNVPFIAVPKLSEIDRNAGFRYPTYFLTQTELAVGMVKTVRIGVNAGNSLTFC